MVEIESTKKEFDPAREPAEITGINPDSDGKFEESDGNVMLESKERFEMLPEVIHQKRYDFTNAIGYRRLKVRCESNSASAKHHGMEEGSMEGVMKEVVVR
ncbi:hypothetical protein TNCV_1726681 [Trichonephila clavipes]|nr:hypothetical protein TNCV_1726681 [Trichonephila clavipes]